jgi:hypothetical protein
MSAEGADAGRMDVRTRRAMKSRRKKICEILRNRGNVL